MKKLLSLALVLAMVLTMSVTAFAADNTLDNERKTGTTEVTHTVSDSYIVTIPDSMTIGTDANVSVKDVVLASDQELTVSVSSTQYNGGWKLKNGDDTIGYTLKIDNTDVANNGTVLTVKSDETATKTLKTELSGTAKYSGNYTDTLTFTVAVAYSYDGTGVTTEKDLNSMLNWLTARLNAGATDIVLNLSDNSDDLRFESDGESGPIDEICVIREISDTIKQSDAVDGTIHLTVRSASAGSYSWSYSENTKLKTITLPDATILAGACFNGCTNLTAVYAPSVTEIVGMPFGGCDNLTILELTATGSFTFEKDGNTSWNSGTSNIDLKLNIDKQSDVVQNQDGTGTWNGNTFNSITFVD